MASNSCERTEIVQIILNSRERDLKTCESPSNSCERIEIVQIHPQFVRKRLEFVQKNIKFVRKNRNRANHPQFARKRPEFARINIKFARKGSQLARIPLKLRATESKIHSNFSSSPTKSKCANHSIHTQRK